ncbi:MAG: hypothetical protein U0Q12_06515 [Vicinamibacterales bacterium]
MSGLVRTVGLGLAGAIASAIALVALYAWQPRLIFDLRRDPSTVLAGLYPIEEAQDGQRFAWSREQVDLSLPGLDRSVRWTVALTYRGARPAPYPQPVVVASVDGVVVARDDATNDPRRFIVDLPAREDGARGAEVGFAFAPTFQPGSGDRRQLGAQVFRLELQPTSGPVLPPRATLAGAELAGGALGVTYGLLGLTPGSAVGAVAVVALGQAVVLAHGTAPFTRLPARAPWSAVGIGAGLLLLGRLGERVSGRALRNTARFVVGFSIAALYLKLLMLWHPDIDIRDALFQAHRFEWVRDGRYYFTSIAPGNYEFPYAIGLYVAGLPFARFLTSTADIVDLLRTIVATADVLAGIALYAVLVRLDLPRLGAAMAVAIHHLVPLNFGIQWVANQTNAFGQSVFTMVLSLVVLGIADRAGAIGWLVLCLSIAATFLTHTSTFAIAGVVFVALAVLLATPGRAEARAAARLGGATIVALLVAWILYYGHFWRVYVAQASRILGETTSAGPAAHDGRTAIERAWAVPRYLEIYYGWAAVALAVVGSRVVAQLPRSMLGPTLLSWLAACLLFLLVGVLTPVDMRYYLAAIPIVAVCGGFGADHLWRAGGWRRAAAVVLLLGVAWAGIVQWLEPLG